MAFETSRDTDPYFFMHNKHFYLFYVHFVTYTSFPLLDLKLFIQLNFFCFILESLLHLLLEKDRGMQRFLSKTTKQNHFCLFLLSRTSSRTTCTRTQQGLNPPWSLRSGWTAATKIQFWCPWGTAMCRQRAESSKWRRRTCWTPDPPPDAACPFWTPTVCR